MVVVVVVVVKVIVIVVVIIIIIIIIIAHIFSIMAAAVEPGTFTRARNWIPPSEAHVFRT